MQTQKSPEEKGTVLFFFFWKAVSKFCNIWSQISGPWNWTEGDIASEKCSLQLVLVCYLCGTELNWICMTLFSANWRNPCTPRITAVLKLLNPVLQLGCKRGRLLGSPGRTQNPQSSRLASAAEQQSFPRGRSLESNPRPEQLGAVWAEAGGSGPVPSWDCRAARCKWAFALVISKHGAGIVPLKTWGTAFCAVTRWLEQPSARCCTVGTASTYPHLLWTLWASLGKRWPLSVAVHCVFHVSNPETRSRSWDIWLSAASLLLNQLIIVFCWGWKHRQ